MMYKNGFDFVDGTVVQTYAAHETNLNPIPPMLQLIYITPPDINCDNILVISLKDVPNLFDLNRIFAYNTTSDKYTAAANTQSINTDKIPIIIKTNNSNWINGASPRFSQIWRAI